MTAALVTVASALPLAVLLAYLVGRAHGERSGERRGRRLRWGDRDEAFASRMEHWRIRP